MICNMEQFKYKNAVVRIHGEVNQEVLEIATINYLKKIDSIRKRRRVNGNRNTSRDLGEEQILDK